jgi:glycosyltransferase involved in cell wall biosynthesis
MPELCHTQLPELSILLPVRDEAINIPIMLKLLKAVVETPYEVLIIYDSPNDNSIAATEAIQPAYPNLRLIFNDHGRGILNALRKGFQSAKGQYVLVSCVDEVCPLLVIDDMVALLSQGCDLVSGTRYAYGGRRLGGSILGTLLSTAANMLFCLFGSVLTDTTTGFKMFRHSCFERLNLNSQPVGWVAAFEIGIKAQLIGLKLGEVPILSVDRLYGGQSTFQAAPWLFEYVKWFCWGAPRLLAQKKRPKVTVHIPAVIPTANRNV